VPEHPKVFISYSHDSPEHKRWVSEIAARLRHNGIDAILDQWDLGPGDDITLFMESGLRDSDRVLVICTDTYVSKANAGEGGVGYERMIVTAHLIRNLGTNKFIPVIRQASGEEKTPTFLATRMYIDLRDESQFETEFEKLLHELHQEPTMQKPPLGKSPFATLPPGQKVLSFEGAPVQLPEIPQQVNSASEAYSEAFEIARAGDILGWRKLVMRIKPRVFSSLVEWRVEWRENELTGQQPQTKERLAEVVDKAIEIISPLIAVALVGVESGREQFRDQKSLIHDILNITGWNSAGDRIWVNIPYALGYVFHSLHGSLSLNTNQFDLALSLARVKLPVAGGTKYLYLWQRGQLRGYPESLGGSCIDGWAYLAKAYKRWDWLSLIFHDKLEYRISLVAYYMALNIHELATVIASGQQNTLHTGSEGYFIVPLSFLSEGDDITHRATSLLRRIPEALMKLWTSLNVTREQMEASWGNWIDLAKKQLLRVYNARSKAIVCLDILRNFFETL
jgi:hypothetical protein